MDDKDVIIDQLMAEIQQLRNENKVLREEISRLKKDSGNSSKPPSSDIGNRSQGINVDYGPNKDGKG